jgi:hypothetical protein
MTAKSDRTTWNHFEINSLEGALMSGSSSTELIALANFKRVALTSRYHTLFSTSI